MVLDMSSLSTARNWVEPLHKSSTNAIVIGDLARWTKTGHKLPDVCGINFVQFETLTADLIALVAPDMILSPLIGDSFDVHEVAARLAEYGFTGRYRAICRGVPDVTMIIAEIATIAPGLDFDLLPLSGPQVV